MLANPRASSSLATIFTSTLSPRVATGSLLLRPENVLLCCINMSSFRQFSTPMPWPTSNAPRCSPNHCHGSHTGFLGSKAQSHTPSNIISTPRANRRSKKQILPRHSPTSFFFSIYKVITTQFLTAHKSPLDLALPAFPATPSASLSASHLPLQSAMPFPLHIGCSLSWKCLPHHLQCKLHLLAEDSAPGRLPRAKGPVLLL